MAQAPSPIIKPSNPGAKDVFTPRTFMQDDFPIIRTACVTLATSVVVASGLIGAGHYALTRQKSLHAQAQVELREVQGKFSAATSEKNDIRDFQPKYLKLAKNGFVSEEKRLDMIEHVRAVQEMRRFLPISYDISPQQIVQIDPSITTGELEVRGSRVQIKMGLLHELDLLNFLQLLGEKGRFIPQSCSINTVEYDKKIPIAARQQGQCTVFWITMGRRVAADGAASVTP